MTDGTGPEFGPNGEIKREIVGWIHSLIDSIEFSEIAELV